MFRLLLAVSTLFLVLCGSALRVAPVAAQDTSASLGITVIGRGLASAPAETATLHLIFQSDDYYSGPPQVPVVEATPGATARSTMEPIVAAITAHEGVDNVTVIVPAPVGSLGRPISTARLDIALTTPEQADILAIVNDAARLASEDRLVIGYIGAWFGVADCAPLESQARQAALDDARQQAEVQAEVVGTDLGEVVASADQPVNPLQSSTYYGFVTMPANSCAPPVPAAAMANGDFGAVGPLYDPATQFPVVEVYREVEVTFASGAAATPAA